MFRAEVTLAARERGDDADDGAVAHLERQRDPLGEAERPQVLGVEVVDAGGAVEHAASWAAAAGAVDPDERQQVAALDPDDRGAADLEDPQAVVVGLDLTDDNLARDLLGEHVEGRVGRLGEALEALADQRDQ